MTVCYSDPLDASVTWEASRTVQVGFINEDDRKSMSDLLYRRRALIFDLYRDPSVLLANIFAYACFLRIMDYATYLRVEEQIRNYVEGAIDPLELVPIIVYEANRDQLCDHIAIINGSTTHPRLISSYYLEITKGF